VTDAPQERLIHHRVADLETINHQLSLHIQVLEKDLKRCLAHLGLSQ